jgi:phage N-6-adenine-methyltransferase
LQEYGGDMSELDRFKGERKPEWETPLDLFDRLNRKFHFTLDVCALPENAKCALYFTPEQDGLKQSWDGHTCWCNPPYGRGIVPWIRKAWETSCNGNVVVLLIPVRSDTAWWHDYILRGKIQFLRGRLYFGGGGRAPFPSAIVVFDGAGDCGELDLDIGGERVTKPYELNHLFDL